MRLLNKRSIKVLAALGVAWTTYEIATFPQSAANWGYRFEALGLTKAPASLYTWAVTRFPKQSPDWAFVRLARLQRDSSKTIEIANLALESNRPAVAATLYRSAIQNAGSSAPPQWFLKYTDLVAPRYPRLIVPLLVLLRDGPASVVELAEALSPHRRRLAMRLYENALRKAGVSARSEWIAGYAEVLFRINPTRAADLFLTAAALDLARNEIARGLQYVERSLAAREDRDVLSQLTFLYLEHDRARAESALERMIALGHNVHWAHRTLGMLHWNKDRLDKARSHLVEAAVAEPYRDALANFDAWRKEAVELREKETVLERSLAEISAERASAVAEHERLSSRLRRNTCDIRNSRIGKVGQMETCATVASA